jgi:hypothetical protein
LAEPRVFIEENTFGNQAWYFRDPPAGACDAALVRVLFHAKKETEKSSTKV